LKKKIDKQANSNGRYQIKIPTTIQDIIMSRVDRLPENCKNILQCAAVIGRKFSYNLLEKFVENNENMTEILAHLLSLELIYQTDFYPELVYMFKNALTQEVTYENILSSKKKFIHAEIGRLIEKLYSSRQAEYYELISHHYEMGEIWDKSIEYFLLSGQQNEQKFEIYNGKGNADFNMGHYRDSESAFLKAREVAKYIGDKNKEGQSLSMAGWSQAVGKKYEEAIHFAVKNSDPIIEGRNLVGLGVIETYLGHVREAGDYIEKAVNIGKKINSPLILTFAYSIRAFQFPHYAIPDEEAVGYLKDAIPTLKSLQNARACVHVYLILGYNYACQGNYSLSINSIQEGINFATEVEDDLSRSRGLNWLGWVYGDLGFISKAKKLNELSQKAGVKVELGSEEPEANVIVNLAENAIEERNFRLAEEYLLSLGEKAESDPGYLSMRHRWEVRRLHGLSKIALNKKEYSKAFEYAHKALDIANETLNVRGKIKLNRLLGDIYIKKNDINNANEKIQSALTEAIKIENPSQLWRTYYAFGRLKEVEGNWEEAGKQYLNAIHIIEKIKKEIRDKEIRDNFMNYFPVTQVQYNINRIKTRVGDKF
jgi:tetratricopeptide (TPR) repeat protein